MDNALPVGKLDMKFLSGLLGKYAPADDRVVIGAKIGEDAAVVDFGDRYVAIKVNPITFATNEIGWYVVNVCVNNMVVRGLKPRWMLNCILLPEKKATQKMVEGIFRQIYEASNPLGIAVIGGHTEVTSGLDRPIVVGTLIGEVMQDALVTSGGAQIGDSILVTKALGVEGTAIIASELSDVLTEKGHEVEFISRAQNFLHDPGISIYDEARAAAKTGLVHSMTDATEGGLASALHEMAVAAGVGIVIKADSVPVYPETKQLCAEFGLDPFGLIASGMMVMTTASGQAEKLQKAIDAVGVQCTVIGSVTKAAEGMQIVREGIQHDLPYYAVDEITKII